MGDMRPRLDNISTTSWDINCIFHRPDILLHLLCVCEDKLGNLIYTLPVSYNKTDVAWAVVAAVDTVHRIQSPEAGQKQEWGQEQEQEQEHEQEQEQAVPQLQVQESEWQVQQDWSPWGLDHNRIHSSWQNCCKRKIIVKCHGHSPMPPYLMW